MAALAGEVVCTCGGLLIGSDGTPTAESDRSQIVCMSCFARWDKKMVMEARQDIVNVVMRKCPDGCQERMIKVLNGAGKKKMKCPSCNVEMAFE